MADERILCSLADGIDCVFRNEGARYLGWPPGSTTDGSDISFCVRSCDYSIDAVGTTFIDFGGELFPFRVRITAVNDSATISADIGQVDPDTGAPPRLPAGSVIVPVRDWGEGTPIAELIVGRRQVPIVWTKAFEVQQL